MLQLCCDELQISRPASPGIMSSSVLPTGQLNCTLPCRKRRMMPRSGHTSGNLGWRELVPCSLQQVRHLRHTDSAIPAFCCHARTTACRQPCAGGLGDAAPAPHIIITNHHQAHVPDSCVILAIQSGHTCLTESTDVPDSSDSSAQAPGMARNICHGRPYW